VFDVAEAQVDAGRRAKGRGQVAMHPRGTKRFQNPPPRGGGGRVCAMCAPQSDPVTRQRIA